MADGTNKNSSAPFGYEYLDGKLRVNPEKSAIVKRIFEWYAGGIGMSEITARLNSQGNEIWHRGTVRSILTNEKYIGEFAAAKALYDRRFALKKIKNRGEKEQFYVSGTHEPIAGKSLFDSVQKNSRNAKNQADLRKKSVRSEENFLRKLRSFIQAKTAEKSRLLGVQKAR